MNSGKVPLSSGWKGKKGKSLTIHANLSQGKARPCQRKNFTVKVSKTGEWRNVEKDRGYVGHEKSK